MVPVGICAEAPVLTNDVAGVSVSVTLPVAGQPLFLGRWFESSLGRAGRNGTPLLAPPLSGGVDYKSQHAAGRRAGALGRG